MDELCSKNTKVMVVIGYVEDEKQLANIIIIIG